MVSVELRTVVKYDYNVVTSYFANEFYYLFWVGQEQGISVLSNAILACTQEIEHHKGKLAVKEAPRVVSANPSSSYFVCFTCNLGFAACF